MTSAAQQEAFAAREGDGCDMATAWSTISVLLGSLNSFLYCSSLRWEKAEVQTVHAGMAKRR